MTDNEIRRRLRRNTVRRAELDAERDELIRQGRAVKIPAVELAADAGLSVPRIYQIEKDS